jgi:hypothetical protein
MNSSTAEPRQQSNKRKTRGSQATCSKQSACVYSNSDSIFAQCDIKPDKTHRPSHPSLNGAPSTNSTHDGSTTESQHEQNSSGRCPLTGKHPSPTSSHPTNDPNKHHHQRKPPAATADGSSTKPLKSLPKTPSPRTKSHLYSVERFVRDFDSREGARMGLVLVAEKGKVATSGRGKGTGALSFEADIGGLGLGEMRKSAGRL